jgi:hypothetical protein
MLYTYYLLRILSFILLSLLVLGFFNPNKSLFWFKGEKTKMKSFIVYFISIIILSFIGSKVQPKEITDEFKKERITLREEQKKKEEERIKNTVHKIKNCNDFKDNTGNYTGFIIGDVFYYNESNTYPLRTLVGQSTEKTVSVSFYHFDEDRNQCNIVVEIPVNLNVPNIMSGGEKVRLNFNCTEGQLNSGNIVNSISRVD